MNGFSAEDMSTAAANGHAEGYQAGYADAVKAVETGKDAAAPVCADCSTPLLYECTGCSASNYPPRTPAAPGIDLEQFRPVALAAKDWADEYMLDDIREPADRLLRLIDDSHNGGKCCTCEGHGMIGGLLPAGGGYDSEPCPDCSPKCVMCGGCGEIDPDKRCLGCLHDFHGGCGACGDSCASNPGGCVVAEQSPPVASPKGGSDAPIGYMYRVHLKGRKDGMHWSEVTREEFEKLATHEGETYWVERATLHTKPTSAEVGA